MLYEVEEELEELLLLVGEELLYVLLLKKKPNTRTPLHKSTKTAAMPTTNTARRHRMTCVSVNSFLRRPLLAFPFAEHVVLVTFVFFSLRTKNADTETGRGLLGRVLSSAFSRARGRETLLLVYRFRQNSDPFHDVESCALPRSLKRIEVACPLFRRLPRK